MISSAELPPPAAARLVTGFAQAVLLALLFYAAEAGLWPATSGLVFAPLATLAVLVPVLLVMGLGHLRPATLAIWVGGAALLLAGLVLYDSYRDPDPSLARLHVDVAEDGYPLLPSPLFLGIAILSLFTAQALITAGDAERKLVARYPTYFDTAWKHAVQLGLSGLFVGAVWALLALGAWLFGLIGIDLWRIIRHEWFSFPATMLAAAAALHLTDWQTGMVRAVRSLLLLLFSWLLPLIVLIVAGFLLSLPFTGLAQLWKTGFAAALLLTAAGALVVLINAAYQDGRAPGPRLLGYAARLAALLLLPLIALAAYAVALRVGQYGWTGERIFAAAALVIAAGYGMGYAAAVPRRGALRGIERANIVMSVATLGVLLLLVSPLADPARLAVADQLARLAEGRVPAEKFDFNFLRFHSKRFGRDALARLAETGEGKDAALIRRNAEGTQKLKYSWEHYREESPLPRGVAAAIAVYPAGRTLPPSFVQQDWPAAFQATFQPIPDCLTDRDAEGCEAYFVALEDGAAEAIILADEIDNTVFQQQGDGSWRFVGTLGSGLGCGLREALRTGRFKTVPSAWQDIQVGDRRFPLNRQAASRPDCQ